MAKNDFLVEVTFKSNFSECVIWGTLRIFLFCRKVMFPSQNIQVFVFLTSPWFTKSVALWAVLVHETGCIFEYTQPH